MDVNEGWDMPKPTNGQDERNRVPVTKTRLRRGEIRREKTEPARTAQIIDFLPAVHSDIENLLCDLSGDNPDDLNPPGPSTDSL